MLALHSRTPRAAPANEHIRNKVFLFHLERCADYPLIALCAENNCQIIIKNLVVYPYHLKIFKIPSLMCPVQLQDNRGLFEGLQIRWSLCNFSLHVDIQLLRALGQSLQDAS